ncbi:MAG: hypothetical protein H7Z73_11765 [Candidatus Saccharibacteria bacterium]|nr:hypothetical protein [Moraxellaceae bacterium]
MPQLLKRKLFRLSALFEIADDEFVSLRDECSVVKRGIVEQLTSGNRQLSLDVVSLRQLLDTSAIVSEICEIAVEAGFNFPPYDPEPDDEDYHQTSDLLNMCRIAGLQTIEEFDTVLIDALPWSEEYLLAQFQAYMRLSAIQQGNWHVTAAFICELLFLQARAGFFTLNQLLLRGYDDDIATRIWDVVQSYRHAET